MAAAARHVLVLSERGHAAYGCRGDRSRGGLRGVSGIVSGEPYPCPSQRTQRASSECPVAAQSVRCVSKQRSGAVVGNVPGGPGR